MPSDDNYHDASRVHPDDVDPFELCLGCPACDHVAAQSIIMMEIELRQLSLDLWVAGWSPPELISEVRRVAGGPVAGDLLAQLLIVDDSHRSEQARPVAWVGEIERLRAQTGINDDGVGWLARWIREQADVEPAIVCLEATVRVLHDLVDPHAVA